MYQGLAPNNMKMTDNIFYEHNIEKNNFLSATYYAFSM